MILSLLLFVSSFFTTANRGEQKSHDYSRGVQGQGGTKFRSADCVYGHHFLSKKTFIPSKPLRSNAKENKKATIIVVALNVKEEQSSEVQTASGPKCRLRLLLGTGLNSLAQWCSSRPSGKLFRNASQFILPKSFCCRKTFVFKPVRVLVRPSTKKATLNEYKKYSKRAIAKQCV